MTKKLAVVTRLNKMLLVFIIALMMPVGYLLAQGPGDDDLGQDPDTVNVPIDGGVSILVLMAVGAGYGARKEYLKKKKVLNAVNL